MSIAVVYYTRKKTTRVAARNIAEKCSAELIEIKEATPVKGFFGAARKALSGYKSELRDLPEEKLKEASTIFIGTPIWAGSSTPAINGFIETADLKDKNIIFFTVQANRDLRGTTELFSKLQSAVEAQGGKFLDAFGLTSSAPKGVDLNEFFDMQLEKWTIFQDRGMVNLI